MTQADDSPFPILKSLAEAWCDRREFWALRTLLQVYPPCSGLTDEWEDLWKALRHLKADGKTRLPQAEWEQIAEALRRVDKTLLARGIDLLP